MNSKNPPFPPALMLLLGALAARAASGERDGETSIEELLECTHKRRVRELERELHAVRGELTATREKLGHYGAELENARRGVNIAQERNKRALVLVHDRIDWLKEGDGNPTRAWALQSFREVRAEIIGHTLHEPEASIEQAPQAGAEAPASAIHDAEPADAAAANFAHRVADMLRRAAPPGVEVDVQVVRFSTQRPEEGNTNG